MKRRTIVGTAALGVVVLAALALAIFWQGLRRDDEPASTTSAILDRAIRTDIPPHDDAGFLYGRVVTDGTTYEGRLRWGGDQEAFWGDLYDGTKDENRWASYEPRERPGGERATIEVFGFRIGGPDRSHLQRGFLARFGDIARLDTQFSEVRVTLKSGTSIALDRFAAGDIDDGVRVWDPARGMVDVNARQIRSVEFLPTPPLSGAPGRLQGVVRTRRGTFTGFIQWNQQDGVTTDTLDGRTADGDVQLRYDTIRSIARQSRGAEVTLADGRVTVLSQSPEAGRNSRGVYVEDARYGRVLISWEALERVEFSRGTSGPAYGDFATGRALVGHVTTRDGRSIGGRLVYDFDESETTETLDVSFDGVDYALPFHMLAAIVPPAGDGRAIGQVVLRSGEELPVERSGDLGERNAGILVFVEGREAPEYVPWADVARIDVEDTVRADDASR